jgi:hypothetical protein
MGITPRRKGGKDAKVQTYQPKLVKDRVAAFVELSYSLARIKSEGKPLIIFWDET